MNLNYNTPRYYKFYLSNFSYMIISFKYLLI